MKCYLFIIGFFFYCSFTLVAEDWTTYKKDYQRSGISTEVLSFPLKEQWIYKSKNPPAPAWPAPAKKDIYHGVSSISSTLTYDRCFHTVTSGEYIYFGSSSDDAVYCLNATNGNVVWKFFTEGPVRLAPVVKNGKVFTGSDDGYMYCLDSKTGTLIWKFFAGSNKRRFPGNERIISLWPIRCGTVVKKSCVYFTSGIFKNEGIFLFCIDENTGKQKWKVNLSTRKSKETCPQGYLIASDDKLYVPTGRSFIYMHNLSNGKFLGKSTPRGGSNAVIDKNFLIHGGSEKSEISILDRKDFYLLSKYKGLRGIITNDKIIIVKRKSLIGYDKKQYVNLLNELKKAKATKNKAKEKELRKQIASIKNMQLWSIPCLASNEVIISKNAIIIGAKDNISAYNINNGKNIWSKKVDGKVYGLAIKDGKLLASTGKGLIYCFGTKKIKKSKIKKENFSTESPYKKTKISSLIKEFANVVIKNADNPKGYCFILDADTGELAYEIVKNSGFTVLCFEKDKRKVEIAREKLNKAGLYGNRISYIQGNLSDIRCQKYIANIILSAKSVVTGKLPKETPKEIFRVLRPDGGIVIIPFFEKKIKKMDVSHWGKSIF